MSSIVDDEEDHRQELSDVEEGDDLKQQVPFDSSEDEEDDDEEEMQKIREGFIVDDEDDDPVEKRKKKHKRRHAEREPKEDEGLLDEDDLDLVMENAGAASSSKEKSKFKRLKKAPVEESTRKGTDLNDFFSEDEEEEEDDNDLGEEVSSRKSKAPRDRTVIDELDDFIEDDEFSDLDEEAREEARQRRKQERLKPTELSGIDSEKVDELYDIFGDGEDYAWALEGEDEIGEFREDDTKPQLQDIYEPEELKARMLTDNDKIIRDTDIPERYQELRKNIKDYHLKSSEFAFEQQWVAYKLSFEKSQQRDPNSEPIDEVAFEKAVGDVLNFIARNNLEVPFIFAHRRDYLLKTTITGEGDSAKTNVETLLDESDIWRIVQLDIEFHALLAKKRQVDTLIEALDVDDQLLKDALAQVQNIIGVQDIYDYVNFQYSAELKDHGLKRSTKNSLYDKIRADKLYELVQAFGITVKDYAENITSDTRIFLTTDHPISPFELADQICADESSLYAKSSQALEAAKHYFAEEFYNNVKIRKHFRDIYTDFATISIDLTESGRLKIDKNSPYADFKYAINRSINEFYKTPDLFLRMLEAEAAHLVEIRLEPISQDKLFEKLFELIESDGQSDIATEWNEYRRSALSVATKKLFPLITLNIKETLRRECERMLFFEIRKSFLEKVDQAPYEPKRANAEFGDNPRVFAISPGNGTYGQDSIIGVFLDQYGKVVETYKFDENPLIPRDRLPEGELSFDVAFSDAIKQVKPDVIAINGFNVKTNKLFIKIREIVDYFQLTINEYPIDVIYVNDEIATRYQNSQRSIEEFPDKSSLVRYVIALARYVQSPLLEYVTLGEDIKTLSIHEHQSLLPEDLLQQAIDTVLVDIVNMVGLDINRCVTDSYLASLLPYVSGLGERKASGLLRAVQQHPLFSRQALITNENIRIGTTVFLNCASFLRIPQNRSDAVKAGNEIEAVTVLDDTRIHPEDYALTEKMAADALDLDEEQIEELKDAPSGETIIDKLLQQGAELLNTLVLEDYSRQLETQYGKKKRATLEMIIDELQVPFQEIRNKFHILNAHETFQTLTGENASSYYEGLVLPVYLKRVSKYQVNAQTSTQIECTALPGGYDDVAFPDKFHVGQTVQAKVKSIDYGAFTAEISLSERDVRNPAFKKKFNKTPGFWDFEREKRDNDLETQKIVQNQRKIRYINHPAFQNLNAAQAQTFLGPKERGAYVIRPSSKGFDHITITWKVDNNLYQHIDVVEHDKENEASLGRSFTIDKTRFSDLDEIIETYVAAIVHKINQMMDHEKFHKGSREEVTKWLENFAKANPDKGAYIFAINHKRPGSFLLLFKVNAKSETFSWNVRTVPGGFELFGYVYPTVPLLCNGFKTVLKNKMEAKSSNSSSRPASSSYNQGYGQSNAGGYNGSRYNSSYNSSYSQGANYGSANNQSNYGQGGYGGYR